MSLQESLKKEYDLGENIGYETDMLEEMEDYIGGYIGDAIMELADSYTEIYTHALWEIAPILKYYIEDALVELGIPGEASLTNIFSQGQYHYNYMLLNVNLDRIVYNMGLEYLESLIDSGDLGDLPAYDLILGDIDDFLITLVTNIGPGDWVDDIYLWVRDNADYLKEVIG